MRARCSKRWRSRSARAALAVCFAVAGAARAQVAELDVRGQLFEEPSPDSAMRVITPAASLRVTPVEWLGIDANYTADIVSGATEPLKAGPQFADAPDIVSHASITDTRHVFGGGLSLRRSHARLNAGYSYGTENDYRSNAVTVSAATDFFQRNTEIEMAYSHGFDQVCDAAINANLAPTNRVPLDSSAGCFSNTETRRAVDIALDNFHAAWTQTWTPVFTTQLVFTGALQNGLLANPYRAVVIGSTGESAQENHPEHRSRMALALRAKYFVKPLKLAIGAGVRGYRDTWDIISQTYELDAERNLLEWLRVRLHGRYYSQTGAVFWSDDYTGGEPVTGPNGQYFSGDREVSPLRNIVGGAALTGSWHGAPGDRIIGALLDLDVGLGVDVMKTYLDDFTWAGKAPNDTFALMANLGLTGTF